MRRSVKTILLLIVLVVIGAAVLRLGHDYFMRTAYPLGYREIVEEEARTQGVDPALVYAVMKAESNFDPDATSHAGARWLMQITPDTFDWLQTKLREGVPIRRMTSIRRGSISVMGVNFYRFCRMNILNRSLHSVPIMRAWGR